MKSLILKDLYNTIQNAKSMLLALLVLAVAFLPSSSIDNYIFMSAILCSMMIVTTFAFDERSGWPSYAMIMPVSRKNLVGSKFICLFIFSAAGILFGITVGAIGKMLASRLVSSSGAVIELPFFLIILLAFVCSTVFGSLAIPLTFRFGAERGRILILVSFFIPAAICYLAYRGLTALGVAVTDQLLTVFFYLSPVPALLWNYIMYRISCAIFAGKEL